MDLLAPAPVLMHDRASLYPVIRVVRGQRVILDIDLACLYGVSTSRLNQQVRRNRRRFPADFMFPLRPKEWASMLRQFATASRKRNRRKLPIAYTEHGAVMAANVLNSDRAVRMSVEVVRAFVSLRKAMITHNKLSRKIADLERAVTQRLDRHDGEIEALFRAVESMLRGARGGGARKRIGFV